MQLKLWYSVCFLTLGVISASAEVQRGTADKMEVDLGYGIKLNEGSSLSRQWVTVSDDRIPAKVSRFSGVRTPVVKRDYQYRTNFRIEVTEELSAMEVVIVLFDVWGDRTKTLSLVEISDFSPGSHMVDGAWRLFSENEAMSHFASIAYVSKVLKKDGKILKANPDPVLEEARRFTDSFKLGDLSPSE